MLRSAEPGPGTTLGALNLACQPYQITMVILNNKPELSEWTYCTHCKHKLRGINYMSNNKLFIN